MAVWGHCGGCFERLDVVVGMRASEVRSWDFWISCMGILMVVMRDVVHDRTGWDAFERKLRFGIWNFLYNVGVWILRGHEASNINMILWLGSFRKLTKLLKKVGS